MLIPSKFSGYRADGIRKYNFDLGGDQPQQQAASTQVSDLPEWAKPYAQDTLARASALTTGATYQPYGGERIAQFTPLQQQAFGAAGSMQPSQGTAQAMGLAGTAAGQAMGLQYNPYATGQFTGGAAGQYMNPYLEQSMAPQIREAQRQSEIQRNVDQARAVGSGAFGGSRQAIVDAERERNLGTQIGDIRAQGYNQAYNQAQQQFNTEQQLREQSRQYGAGLGLQGLQTALQGAGLMGNLGGQQFQQGMDITNLQNQMGTQQQQQIQNMLSQQYQDFLNQQKFPYQQLDFMSGLIRGTPMGTVNTLYQAQPTMTSQLAGLGTAAYGASKLIKKGGAIKEPKQAKGSGLADLALSKI